MTITAVNLEPALQQLVDDRLDAIDQVLLRAGVSRGERRSIVEEVEAQIFELLSRRTGGEPSREDVIAMLSKLDPPEAYAPEPYRQRIRQSARTAAPRMRRPQPSLLALGSAVAGLIFAFLTFIMIFFIIGDQLSEIALLVAGAFLLPAGMAVTAGGVAAIVRIRRSEGWLFGLRAGLFAAGLFPLLLVNGLILLTVMIVPLAIYFVPALAMLAGNALVAYQVWKMVASDYHRAAPEVL